MHTTPSGSAPTVLDRTAELSARALGGTAFSYCWPATAGAERVIESIAHLDEANEERGPSAEIVGGHIRDLADVMVSHDVDAIGKPAAMSREEKTQVLRCVEARGAFLLKPSADQATEALDLPHFTIVGYPREIRHGEARSHAEA